MKIILTLTPKPSNAAYVHARCAELGVEERLCSEPEIGRYELASTLARLTDCVKFLAQHDDRKRPSTYPRS